jgi:hypothetical protein
VCVRERECVCVCERESVCVCARERERESVCVRVELSLTQMCHIFVLLRFII